MPSQRRRTWKDGDTDLVFGLLVVACGAAILQHALRAENWLSIADAPAYIQDLP